MNKKTIVILTLLAFTFVPSVFAKDKEITVTWTQILPSPNDLAGWNICFSETPGGPYRFLAYVPFSDVKATYSFTVDKISGLNFKKKADMYFVIQSVDADGNLSAFSAETSLNVDNAPSGDMTAPAVPGGVTASKK